MFNKTVQQGLQSMGLTDHIAENIQYFLNHQLFIIHASLSKSHFFSILIKEIRNSM